MKLLAGNRRDFEKGLDRAFGTAESLVCRYRNLVQFPFNDHTETDDRELKRLFVECSIQEGARITDPLYYRGVTVHILDETSLMATGSLKSIDGCLVTALCRLANIKRVVFESGGNTGVSLTRYGTQAGIETFFFCPEENLDLFDGQLFQRDKAHLIAVADRRKVKEMAKLFADETKIRHIPDKAWRYGAAMFRGLFILEELFKIGHVDWFSQTVSAGFGPIGIYKVLNRFKSEIENIPKFLGLQQEANCALYLMHKTGKLSAPTQTNTPLLTRVMYDEFPQTYKTFEDMKDLLETTGGDFLTVNENEFNATVYSSKLEAPLLEELSKRKISITQNKGNAVERTGLISLVGVLKAIDQGLITPGQTVLCSMTSGVTKADGRAKPELIINGRDDVLKYVKTVRG